MKRRVMLMLCMVCCLVSVLAGCSLTRENPNLAEKKLVKKAKSYVTKFWDAEERESQKTQYADVIDQQFGGLKKFKVQYKEMGASDEQIDQVVEIYNSYKEYARAKKKYGTYKKIIETNYSLAASSASVAITIETDKGKKVVFTMNYDKHGEMTDHKYEEYKTVGQIMGKAALNTVMSMAIVFCVLIFIALLISCFKFIGAVQNRSEKTDVPATVAAPAAEEPVAEENLADDLELVAVITAAIAAAEGTESADGLTVRSIVRRL